MSDLLICGLENGMMSGWNLATNSFDKLPAHSAGITAISRHDQFLMTGDRMGQIQVRNST